MPHDAKGNLLKPGDKVVIPATIISVTAGEYCTTEVQLDHLMPPNTEPTRIACLNAAQVEKIPNQGT